jgi:hypothetical protein
MKMKVILLLAIAIAAALSFAHPASANLITNGGFETGDFTGWQVGGSPSVTGTIDKIAPHSGSFQAAFGAGGDLRQDFATIPGQSYTITFWLASSLSGLSGSSPNDHLFVEFGSTQLLSLTNVSGFGYTEYTFTETASTASTRLEFAIGGFILTTGDWLFDDVSVNPAGVPDAGATLPLLGFALLGLAAVRRRQSSGTTSGFLHN